MHAQQRAELAALGALPANRIIQDSVHWACVTYCEACQLIRLYATAFLMLLQASQRLLRLTRTRTRWADACINRRHSSMRFDRWSKRTGRWSLRGRAT